MAATPTKHELEIIRRLESSDPKAIELIFDHYHTAVYKKINAMVLHQQDTEDLVQDVYKSIWENRKKTKLVAPIGGYLLKAAQNHALNFLARKERTRGRMIDVYDDIATKLPEEHQPQRRDLLRELRKSISKLPPRTRMAYLLSRNYNMSNIEIASRMSVTTKAIEKHITKAIRLLRKFLPLISLLLLYSL